MTTKIDLGNIDGSIWAKRFIHTDSFWVDAFYGGPRVRYTLQGGFSLAHVMYLVMRQLAFSVVLNGKDAPASERSIVDESEIDWSGEQGDVHHVIHGFIFDDETRQLTIETST